MDPLRYIDLVAEYVPRLLDRGFEVGDFNDALPVIHVSRDGIETYVHTGDREQLESLLDAAPPEPREDPVA